MSDYPQHEKLSEIREKSQAIGEFLDWMREEKEFTIAEYDKHDQLWPAGIHTQRLLAEFFEIDYDALMAEKDAMLEAQRELNRSMT